MTWHVEHHRISMSAADGATRGVTVAIPLSQDLATAKVVYCADGQAVETFASALPCRQGSMDQPVLIGVHSHPANRAQEYILSSKDAYRAHENFFCEDVRSWAHQSFGITTERQRSIAFGFSNGGAFALVAALRRPDLFASVISLSTPSIGMLLPVPTAERSLPSIYLASGDRGPEKTIRKNVLRIARWLERHGFEAEVHERTGGHDLPFWTSEFALAVRWLMRDGAQE